MATAEETRNWVDETTGELLPVVQPPARSVFGTDSPIAIAESTTSIAHVLRDALRRGGMTSKISGRDYVRIEGWSYLGALLGVSPQTRAVEPLRRDSESPVVGFSATVDLVTKAGEVVGGGTAICTRDERNWETRDDYALMSMAQTRAAGKAFRMTYGFIMTEAGYEATPAEEMVSEPRSVPRDSAEDRLVAELGVRMKELGFERGDLAPVLEVERVTKPSILRWLADHGNDIEALLDEVGESIVERAEAGEDI